jgi:hypothetical protein
MGRMTRAKAAEVAERMHIDEDAVLDMSLEKIDPTTPASTERSVLGDIAPNSADGKGSDLVGRKTRSKKNGQTAAESKAEQKNEDHEENGINEQAEEDALDASTDEMMERLAKLRITSLGNQPVVQSPDGPQSENNENNGASNTLPDVAEATFSESHGDKVADVPQPATPTPGEQRSDLPSISIVTQSQLQEIDGSEEYEQEVPEAPSSPVATAVPRVIKSLRKDTPSKRSASNKENVEPMEPLQPVEQEQGQVAVADASRISPNGQDASPPQTTALDTAAEQSATSPPVRRQSTSTSGDAIEAMDNAEEAVEKVNLEISEAHSPGKKLSPKPTEKPVAEKGKPKKTKPAPVVRLTKATAARLSMAQAANKDSGNAPALGRPRPSTMLGRTAGVHSSVVPAAANKPSPKPRKETVIPHSKPRPVLLSFPTPPPAARSTKAPTKSSFQLPGEAVAAKLKAAREERMKREAAATASKASSKATADEKKPAFKARPVPSTLKKTPSVRHTAASRAREPGMTGDSALKPTTSSSTTGLKRSNTVGSSRPRPSTVPATTTKPSQPPQLTVQKRARPSSVHVSTSATAAPRKSSGATRLSAVHAPKDDTEAPRKPSSGASRPSIAPAARNISATSKGKEVYARFSAARNAAESDKREKEDAARKARAAAAEKGRVASREWAQKQKVKNMIAKVEGQVAKA